MIKKLFRKKHDKIEIGVNIKVRNEGFLKGPN